MVGTMKIHHCILHKKEHFSHRKKNLLFLPCNVAAVQNLYSPVGLEQARLLSSLITCKLHLGHACFEFASFGKQKNMWLMIVSMEMV